MNDNAKQWVAALRSGEFRQGKGALATVVNDGIEYCCLGVACVVAKRNGVSVTEERRDLADGETLIAFDGETGIPPLVVMQWLNLDTKSGAYKDVTGRHSELTSQNDDGRSFQEIADIIEAEPQELFKTS